MSFRLLGIIQHDDTAPTITRTNLLLHLLWEHIVLFMQSRILHTQLIHQGSYLVDLLFERCKPNDDDVVFDASEWVRGPPVSQHTRRYKPNHYTYRTLSGACDVAQSSRVPWQEEMQRRYRQWHSLQYTWPQPLWLLHGGSGTDGESTNGGERRNEYISQYQNLLAAAATDVVIIVKSLLRSSSFRLASSLCLFNPASISFESAADSAVEAATDPTTDPASTRLGGT